MEKRLLLLTCCSHILKFKNDKLRSRGRVARQRSAKPFTAVRVRSRPQENFITC